MNLPSPISVALITECCARGFNITALAIRGRQRNAEVMVARHVVAWIAREVTSLSLPEIGRRMGDRHHTTIMNSIAVVEERRASDPGFLQQVDAIKAAVELAAREVLEGRFKDVDAVEVAERIMRNPPREATRISTLEVTALSARLLALEDLADVAYQLLAHVDELQQRPGGERRDAALTINCHALIRNTAEALAALGYSPDHLEERNDGQEDEDQGTPAGAAAAAN